MKTIVGVLSLVFCAIAIVLSIVFGIIGWHIKQDIGGWQQRAQVSMEPDDMTLYMTNVKEGMQKWGVTEGNASLFFPTPATDMSLIFRAVNQHINTAKSLIDMDRSSIQYATGLDNLRGGIRELSIPAYQYYANHQYLGANVACCVFWVLFFAFGVWYLFIW